MRLALGDDGLIEDERRILGVLSVADRAARRPAVQVQVELPAPSRRRGGTGWRTRLASNPARQRLPTPLRGDARTETLLLDTYELD